MIKIKSDRVYFTDNGRTLCGDHLGVTARMTGRDLSGQPIAPISPEDIRMAAEMDIPLECETCGRWPRMVVTPEAS